MARGKHKAAKQARDEKALAAQIEQVRTELDVENTRLASARAAVDSLNSLRSQLRVRLGERDRAAAGEAARLSREIDDVLTPAVATAEADHERLSERWNPIIEAVTKAFGGGQDGLERALTVVGGTRAMVSEDITARHGNAAASRIQLARGERRYDWQYEGTSPHTARSIAHLLRRCHRHALDSPDADPSDPAPSDQDGEHPDAASAVAEHVRRSTPESTELDAVHAWHPAPWISLASLYEGPMARALGLGRPADVDQAIRTVAPVTRPELPSAPQPVMPAVTRWALAATITPDELTERWRHDRMREAVLTQRAGRVATPWAPSPRYPRPGDAVSIKFWYAQAATGLWSRRHDELDEPARDSTSTTYGAAAIAMSCAAPLWVPPGQGVGYLDSEPLRTEDVDAIRLPYPQTLVVFADPIQLPPAEAGQGAPATPADRVVLDELRLRTSGNTLSELVTRFDDLGAWSPESALDLGTLLAERGARVEAVLLLSDALGVLEDQFTWCLAVPAAAGGVLMRLAVPASRAQTTYQSEVNNVAALAAWADWHPPGPQLSVPPEVRRRDLTELTRDRDFHDLERRGGTGNVRVLNVKRTNRDEPGARLGDGRSVSPHFRRGHWRRQHYGPGGQEIRRVRIAPTAVNAGAAPASVRVYRLPTPT